MWGGQIRRMVQLENTGINDSSLHFPPGCPIQWHVEISYTWIYCEINSKGEHSAFYTVDTIEIGSSDGELWGKNTFELKKWLKIIFELKKLFELKKSLLLFCSIYIHD